MTTPSPTSSPTAIGYWQLLRSNRAFRLLWGGQIVSLLGDWFGLVASASLVAELTGSAFAVGGLFVVRMLPPFLISPVAGVIVDRSDRKRLLIMCDLARMFTVIGFLFVREPSQVWLLYALTAIQLGFSGVFFPARNALLPSLVSQAELGSANALSSVSWSVMLAFGAALGGVVAGRFGVYTAFTVDAISYLGSAIILTAITGDHTPPATGDRSLRGAVRQYFEGFTYLNQHREVLFTSLHKALFGLTMGGALSVVQVELAQHVFVYGKGGSTSLGLMYAIAGIGTGVGPIISRKITGDRRHRLRRAIVVAYLTVAVGIAIIAPLASFPLILAGIFIRGVGGGINWVYSTQLLMMALPNEVRGRVFATEFAAFTLAQAIGTATCGWALDHTSLGLGGVITVMAMLPLIPGTLWMLWLRRLEHRESQSSL